MSKIKQMIKVNGGAILEKKYMQINNLFVVFFVYLTCVLNNLIPEQISSIHLLWLVSEPKRAQEPSRLWLLELRFEDPDKKQIS